MPDDIITVGGRGRRSEFKRDCDEAIESLFRAHYARMVNTAFGMIDDWDLAERLVQEAYLTIWRWWRWIGDPRATTRSRLTIRRRVAGRKALAEPERVILRYLLGLSEAEAEARLPAAGSQPDARTNRAWRELSGRRSHEVLRRRKHLSAGAFSLAAAAVTVTVIATVAVAGNHPATAPPQAGSTSAVAIHNYPQAVTARIPMAGYGPVAQDRGQLWAIRFSGGDPAYYPIPTYYLVRIDLRTNKIVLQVDLGRKVRVVAAGGGMVWLTTPHGQAAGQIARIDPATGRVMKTLHLPAGQCTYIAYVARRLAAECTVRTGESDVLWINPHTGHVVAKAGPVPWPPTEFPAPGMAVAVPQGVWFVTSTGVSGLVGSAWRHHLVTVNDPAYPVSFAYTVSLAYGDGFVWALTNDESVAKIDPATGKVLQVYTYATYDPAYGQDLTWLAVGHGSIWFAVNGTGSGSLSFQGVLRVSSVTGKLAGRIPVLGPISCGGACWQIYSTPGGIWMPTAKSLIRLDPARLPG